MALRFNHMELTLPPGALDDATRSEIKRFYGDVFGWNALDVPILGQHGLLLRTDAETSQFVLVVESKKPVSVPGYDHLGLLLETRAEVDRALAAIRSWQARDGHVQIKEYQDLVQGDVTVHAFYVRYLLPIWFDVQCME
ncbi:MAG: hypothetical protein E6J87_09635 [Deltaproteobacteria bacterium]|nr:MAG: hypothetical protein E6J87_09635 [Deltaproteobacteria bacterium]